MSRTDNTRPWKIRAEDPIVQATGVAYYFHGWYSHMRGEGCGELCGWNMRHWALGGAPPEYVHLVWWGPERSRERNDLRAMAKEWNANHDLDEEDFPNYQHRHCATWWWF